MTAPRRTRTARPAREPRPAVVRVPSADVRRRRGPKPPDDVVAALERALIAELAIVAAAPQTDATIDPSGVLRLGRRWLTAVARAARAIAVRARRGVLGALQGTARTAAESAPVATPPDWEARTTAAVEASVAASMRARLSSTVLLERAAGVASAAVFSEHARQIQARAVAAGSTDYVWITQKDERVRAGHAALEGTRQRWAEPPVTDPVTGYRAHPGEPRNCRCMPWVLVRVRAAVRSAT